MSDPVAYYAAAVSTGGLLWQVRTWNATRLDAQSRDERAFGTNIRIDDFTVLAKGSEVLVLGARVVNDSGHDVVLRHAYLRWGPSDQWDFSAGAWPTELQLNLGRNWIRAAETDLRDHGTALKQDELIGSRRGVKTTAWAAKSFFLANGDEPVALRLLTDDGTSIDSSPLDWRPMMIDEAGWEHLRTPGELPPFLPDKI
jgi:hypothetical protein